MSRACARACFGLGRVGIDDKMAVLLRGKMGCSLYAEYIDLMKKTFLRRF